MNAIFKREFRSYFTNMIGYLFIAVILVFIGIYFMAINLASGYPYFSYTLVSAFMFFLFCIPILTMRSMAEERKNKTDQMLLTYPVSIFKVVGGKFLAMAAVLTIPLAVCCICPLILYSAGAYGTLSDYATILAMFCLGCMFISIGMFISSLTENQIIAAVGTFVTLLALYMWDDLLTYLPQTVSANMIGCLIAIIFVALLLYLMSGSSILAMAVALIGAVAVIITYFIDSSLFLGLLSNILGALSVMTVLDNFAFYFVFDWAGLFLYLSVTALFLFLTVQTVQKRRWH